MDYQYIITAQDLKQGIQYEGVFKSYEEAEQYKKQLKLPGTCLSCGPNNKPYGKTSFNFDLDKFWEMQREWLGDHKITGSD